MSKTVGVFGSTGHQGGGVVRSLLEKGFKVKSFTRNPDSESAKKLKSLGSEVIKCDESQSPDVLEKSFQNCDCIFLVTNSEAYSSDLEFEYGKKIADVALKAGVKHFVFSTLPNTSKASKGKHHVEKIDAKYNIEQYIRNLSKENPRFQSSFVLAPWYFQNFLTFFPLQLINEKEQKYALTLPNEPKKKYNYGDISQMGQIVSHIMQNPNKYNGELVVFPGQLLTPLQIVEIFSKVTNKQVIYNYIPPEEYSKLSIPGAKDFADLFAFYNDYDCESLNAYHYSLVKDFFKLKTLNEYLIEINYEL